MTAYQDLKMRRPFAAERLQPRFHCLNDSLSELPARDSFRPDFLM
jgi:hypothetical protein